MVANTSDRPFNDSDITCSSIDEVKQLRGRLSLKLLNTVDPFIEIIINQTPFVTGYFMSSDDKWSRMGIEGFLYVVKRSRRPLHSFILINKKSEDHLVEYLTPEFQMNQDRNFIFYRSKDIKTNTINSLKGLWFFDESECKNTYQKLTEITTNTSPLKCNLSSINSLYENLDDVAIVIRDKDDDKTKESTEPKIKSIGSFLLDSISIKPSRTNKTNYSNVAIKELQKFQLDEDPVNTNNLGGKHLMTLLKSSAKPDTSTSPIESDSDTLKIINTIDLNVIDSPAYSDVSSHDKKITITYEMLKETLSEVLKGDKFISLLWEELKSRINHPIK